MTNPIVRNGYYVNPVADVSKQSAFIDGDSGTANQVTVPSGESWEILGAIATVSTSSTVGNRTFVLRVSDADSNSFSETAAASNVPEDSNDAVRNYTIGGSPDLLKGLRVPAGAVIDVYDSADIDAANDTIAIKLMVVKHFEG
ncbi:MAG: hypothetical protein ACFE0I_02595 [Elainellaceae cyanobacterium]